MMSGGKPVKAILFDFDGTMKKIKFVLKKQFGIDCIDITGIHGGLSAMNYKIRTGGQTFFLKVYDKKKTQSFLWTENIDSYMPVLVWLNENTKLCGRIVCPLKTVKGEYRFDDDENVFLLFEYVEGATVGKALTHTQLLEAADIMACLHGYGKEIPVSTENIAEDFSVPFCFSLERFISENYEASPADVKRIVQPRLAQLLSKNDEVKLLSEKVKNKNIKMVLCHTDAHGYNFMQGGCLTLVDWEGIKLAPAEADLLMFSKKEYWDIFFGRYKKMRPDFHLDNDVFTFYILRRKMEDIWAFIAGILFDDLSVEDRRRDLGHLSDCCNTLENLWFEL